MRSLPFAVVVILTVLVSVSSAIAVWGVPQWGTMAPGEAASAGLSSQAGGMVLLISAVLAAAAFGLRRPSSSALASLLVMGLALPVAGGALGIILPGTPFLGGTAANAEEPNADFEITAATPSSTLLGGASSTIVTMPYAFVNGQVAEAPEVNANFLALEAGVETVWGQIIAATQGACTEAGGTWESDACTPAPDVTANDAEVCTTAGGTWATGTCTAAGPADYTTLGSYPACLAAAHCTSLGGYVGGSTCYLVATHPGPWGEVEVPVAVGDACS